MFVKFGNVSYGSLQIRTVCWGSKNLFVGDQKIFCFQTRKIRTRLSADSHSLSGVAKKATLVPARIFRAHPGALGISRLIRHSRLIRPSRPIGVDPAQAILRHPETQVRPPPPSATSRLRPASSGTSRRNARGYPVWYKRAEISAESSVRSRTSSRSDRSFSVASGSTQTFAVKNAKNFFF